MGGVWCTLDVEPFDAFNEQCDGKKVPELKAICKEEGKRGYSKLKRDDLVQKCCVPTVEDAIKKWNASTWIPESFSGKPMEKRSFPELIPSEYRTLEIVKGETIWVSKKEYPVEINDGKMSIEINEEDERSFWNEMLGYEHQDEGTEAIADFVGKFMKKGTKVTMKTQCDVDSTGTKDRTTYSIVKDENGKVTRKYAGSESWDPDDF